MPSPHPSNADRSRAIRNARTLARNATLTLAGDTGSTTIPPGPVPAGGGQAIRDVDPLAGMRAARDLELAVRDTALGYIRQAREAGRSWHQIGVTMHLYPGTDRRLPGETFAETAFTYATADHGTDTTIRHGQSFTWTCHGCDKKIRDYGLCNGPAHDEHGHAGNCPRLAATIAEWDAEWEPGQ